MYGTQILEFRQKLAQLSREELLEIIHEQNPELVMHVERIEYVFAKKLRHLNWPDGKPIMGRTVTNEELALLIDQPFEVDDNLVAEGVSPERQYQAHIAADPVLWARHFLNAKPRAYQIFMLRHPKLRKILRAGRRLGKALDIETPIATVDQGWKTMGTLEVGDRIFDEHGKPCNVTYVAPIRTDRKCYDVIFSDGSKITADGDHLWTTHTKQYRKALGRANSPMSSPVTMTTEGIKATLRVGPKNEVNHAIPVAGAVEYPEQDLPIDPYVLGLWLGDGVTREASISIHEPELLVHIKECGYELTQWKDPNMYTIHGIAGHLRSLGVLNNKHIPEIYLTASIEQREALLQGLMDSDGSVRKSDGYCEFSVKLEELAKNTHELAASLGLRPTIREGRSTLYGRDCGPRYRVGFTPNFFTFRLMRKLLNQTISDNCRYRYIVDVVEVESVPVRCISVDSPNNLFLAGKSYIATHNTWTMAVKMLHRAYTNNNARVLVMAPMKSQVELLFKQVLTLAKESDIVWDSISKQRSSPQFYIELKNGSTISFFTTGMRSGGKADVARGQEAHLIVLDELDYMAPEDLDAIYVMLQKTDEGQAPKELIGASTPTGLRQRFWKWCNSPRFKEFWFPSYVNPNFEKADEDEFREEYSEMAYRHEVEADWGESADGVYPRKYVDAAFNSGTLLAPEDATFDIIKDLSSYPYDLERIQANSVVIIGVDWDKYGAGVNIAIMEMCTEACPDPRFKNKIRLMWREEMAKDEYAYHKAVDKIIQLNLLLNPKWIYVDRGAGETQIEMLHKHGVENPETGLRKKVKGIAFKSSIEVRDPATKKFEKKEMKPFMVESMRYLLEKGQLVFSGDDEDLYLQYISYVVASTTYTGTPKFEMAGNVPDHAHDAIMLACLAITEHYNDLLKSNVARRKAMIAVSNSTMTGMPDPTDGEPALVWSGTQGYKKNRTAKVTNRIKRPMSAGAKMGRSTIKRKKF